MKRVILSGIFCAFFSISFAQWNEAFYNNNSSKKIAIGIYGDGDLASNSITSTFAYNFASSNYIDSNLKQQVASKLQARNRIGFCLNYGIYAVLYNDSITKKKAFNFFIALRHKNYFNATFSPDDFKLAFYGNAGYAGQTALLSPFSLNNLSYYQAELGLIRTNFGGSAQFGVGLSFLAGQHYASVSTSSASLYTDPYGQYLQLNINAEANQSDTSSKNVNNINGYGASLDIFFRAPFKLGSKDASITVNATDLGFIWWNNHSLTYQKDTIYYYNGIVINGLTDLQNPSIQTLSKDSLRNKYFPYSKGSFYAAIPTTLNINASVSLTEKFHLEGGYSYIFNANAIGYIYAQADKYFTHNWMLALQLGYGGYTTINGNLAISKKFKASSLGIKVYHIQGLTAPDTFGGVGTFLEYVQLL